MTTAAEAAALVKLITPLIAAEVARQLAAKPPRDGRDGRDGKSIKGDKGDQGPPVDMSVVSTLVAEKVLENVKRIPVPKNGIDGRDGVDGEDAMPLVPAWAYFEKDPANDQTLRVQVVADSGEIIQITPQHNVSGIERARIERVA